MKRIILPLAILTLSGFAQAHPHKSQDEKAESKIEKSWPYFGKKVQVKDETLSGKEFAARLEERFSKHAEKLERSLKEAEIKNDFLNQDREIKSAEDIRDAAKALEDVIAESGVISNLADMMLGLAEDFDVETTDEGLSLKFDGERIGRVKVKRDKHTESSLDVEGFGRNMTIEKEVIKRNGKTKTRIIIEVDGDEDFDIDLKPKN